MKIYTTVWHPPNEYINNHLVSRGINAKVASFHPVGLKDHMISTVLIIDHPAWGPKQGLASRDDCRATKVAASFVLHKFLPTIVEDKSSIGK